ncbi:MAG: alkaline phosphatase D family protein [Chitinophagales bacterium]|nr:alkaline phosphatase D family protein [Chitinophagales bacterium]
MKFIVVLLSILFLPLVHFAQSPTGSERSALNPALYPFYHGVASGDPLTDRVILWTRITLDPAVSPVTVSWQIASDASFNGIVNSGNITTDSSKDYTLKVDATGLQPNTWYYYRFGYDTFYSVIGRTRTLPTGAVNNLRFAVASCQDYQSGFYNAHRHIAERNDLDAVLFLGDYTYEDAADNNPVGDRFHEPNKKTTLLVDYRLRQSQYHLDPDLQEAHRQYPWIAVWDDHETANNSYTDSAKNHNVNDGLWANRKSYAVKAYEEWMPIRLPDPNDSLRIFRKFKWGELLELYMIDTRLYDRDKQAGSTIPITNTELNDSTRTMVGPVQFNWLETNMQNSTAQWQVLGQQVMMTPLVIPSGVLGSDPYIVNGDQWDGYPFERQRFYDMVKNDSLENIVVLTGDIHTGWANDLPQPGYDAQNRNLSAGVEFVTPSITSGNELPPLITAPVISSLAPHVRYVELVLHGYYVLDFTPQRTQADFVYVSTITAQTFTASSTNHWCVNAGERFLNTCTSAAVPLNSYPPLAPWLTTSIKNVTDNITTISMYPNPFLSEVVVQYNVATPEPVTLQVFAADGKLMMEQNLGMPHQGTNYATFDGSQLPAGMYRVILRGKSQAKGEAVLKVN